MLTVGELCAPDEVRQGGRAMAAKPIVAGTDGSEESLRAVDWAAREAVLRGAPLRIVAAAARSAGTPPATRPARWRSSGTRPPARTGWSALASPTWTPAATHSPL